MRYVDSIVAPEEEILHRGRLHWTIFLYPSAFLTLFLLPLARWLTCEAVVTSRRIVIASGFLRRSTFELSLSRFESIRVEQSLLARLLGFGSVLVVGVGGGRQAFLPMARPMAFRKAMVEAAREVD
ncbi:PH domain-containing protein [Anaeromyxobacter paludicola]|uniref:YdbS-like PH domain-containing protein n=1 Tax=Anaeromyxobacter paludicola TaxID=2918171 RepID=A0ABM7X9W6_9BACT|nr:PH domain-containing protein [Anaeromyxobacter paludicola]BDG08624.1 hypothetical protein AMPC_17370 [Anaeromyxobacter paludicola]